MNFLAILVSLLLDQGLRHLEPYREFPWFASLRQRLRRDVSSHREYALALLVLVVLLPTILADLLTHGLTELSPVLAFLFAVTILLVSLGPHDASHLVHRYLQALDRHDEIEAHRAARLLIEEAPPSDRQGCGDAVTEYLLARVNERLFGPIFWFAILGPAGAILFWMGRMIRRSCHPTTSDEDDPWMSAARRIYGVLAWLPACLLALSYALVGGFDSGWNTLRGQDLGKMLVVTDGTERMLKAVGCAALAQVLPAGVEGAERIRAARRLVRRSLFLWLAILAVFTLGGWLF